MTPLIQVQYLLLSAPLGKGLEPAPYSDTGVRVKTHDSHRVVDAYEMASRVTIYPLSRKATRES